MSTRTIDCEQAIRHLAAYLDREIGARDRRDLEAHLERCRSCYSRAEFERRLKAQLADLRRGTAAPALERRIRRLIDGFGSAP